MVGLAALVVLTSGAALIFGLRPTSEPSGRPILGTSPTEKASASATDVLVTAAPYLSGSCPVTPITDLAGGVEPEVVAGGIRWVLDGAGPWAAEDGHKVGLFATSPDGVVDASAVLAERLPIGADPTPLSVRYPRGGGPGFIFGVGLPEPGCWALTAVGTGIASTVVVEVGPAPTNPQSANSQNVPTEQSALVPLTECPTSPQVPGVLLRTWLDGDSRWQDADAADWTAGIKRKIAVSGAAGSPAPYEVVVATLVGTVGAGDSQRSAFVADKPVFTAPVSGAGSKEIELTLPSAGCWAITYLDSAVTSTIVVEIAR